MSAGRVDGVRRTTRRLLLVTLGMFGFGFAMVPFYDVFCEITGLGGRTSSTAAEGRDYAVDTSRTVTVEFIANLNEGLPWEFRPEVGRMKVHPGQTYTTRFYVRNRTDAPMLGHAVPSVAPPVAARHFQKTECFCFTEQRFEGGEGRWMPVRFVLDPELPEKYEVVTLSYTFFDSGAAAPAQARLERLDAGVGTN